MTTVTTMKFAWTWTIIFIMQSLEETTSQIPVIPIPVQPYPVYYVQPVPVVMVAHPIAIQTTVKAVTQCPCCCSCVPNFKEPSDSETDQSNHSDCKLKRKRRRRGRLRRIYKHRKWRL